MRFCNVLTADLYEKSNQKKSLSDVKIAGSQYLCGFPFSVLAKCLQFFEKKCEENFEKVIRLDNWFPNRTWHQE